MRRSFVAQIASVADAKQPNHTFIESRQRVERMNSVDPAATAFAHRSSEVLMISATFVSVEATVEETAKAMIPWKTIAPFTSGAYINFFSTTNDEDQSPKRKPRVSKIR